MIPALVIFGSYMLGAVPFGLMIARWWAGIDVREHGSGNIGATNVYRVVGKPAGVLVFALDVLKGFTPPMVAFALRLDPWWQVSAGFAAILGHNFSPFLGFKGGKGISTSLGVLLGVAPLVGLTAFGFWAVVLLLSGYVSLGSIIAAALLAPLSWLYYRGDSARLVFCLVAGLFAIVKHRSNIQRLLNGTESSFRRRKVVARVGEGETGRREGAS